MTDAIVTFPEPSFTFGFELDDMMNFSRVTNQHLIGAGVKVGDKLLTFCGYHAATMDHILKAIKERKDRIEREGLYPGEKREYRILVRIL
jgi:hypothetical protein